MIRPSFGFALLCNTQRAPYNNEAQDHIIKLLYEYGKKLKLSDQKHHHPYLMSTRPNSITGTGIVMIKGPSAYLILSVILSFLLLAGCSSLWLRPPKAEKLLANSAFDWSSDTTAHFIIHYEKQSPAAERLGRIKVDVERSFASIESLLGESYPFRDHLQVFVVSSRRRMKDLIGYETNGVAFYRTEVLCYLVTADMMLSATHELLHVMAMNMWGQPSVWLNEGLAVYADNHWHNHDLHALSSHLHERGELIPFEELISSFRKHDDLIAYPVAGSLVKYIYEGYGIEAIKLLWEGGSIEEATGMEVSELEQAWLHQLPTPEQLDYKVR